MKKIFVFYSFLILALLSTSPVLSQQLTVGILNGINFTQPKGYFASGKWEEIYRMVLQFNGLKEGSIRIIEVNQ